MIQATYILPLKLVTGESPRDLIDYLASLDIAEIIVVDGSSRELFDRLHRHIGTFTTHVQPSVAGLNGKARGVLTGLALATKERVAVADDDVRYDTASLRAALERLDRAHVVRPQNFFSPAPWHAIWDSARSLINRALDGDWPGTLVFRRSALPKGYNPDVLFENYELVRTIRAGGGREDVARDLFVKRQPPALRHFLGQRVRQAYDEFARPWRMAGALALLPALIWALHAAGPAAALLFAALTMALAAIGWLREGAHRYFSALGIFAAPLWALERGVCSWLALWERMRYGGVRYGGSVIEAAASPGEELTRWAS